MGKLKDKLFYWAVEKNPYILRDYQKYKWGHQGKKENKFKSWAYLALLNLKYRQLKIQDLEENAKGFFANKKETATIRKLPYLDGPESEAYRREKPEALAKRLLAYDVISFDIFDTLILRPFAQPHDLFMVVGEKLNIVGYSRSRRLAEKSAREKAFVEKGNHEISIYDIYEILEFKLGIDKNYGVQLEFETELEFCFPNPYMQEVFQILKDHGKRLIAVSDMYLTTPMIVKLLEKNGYTGFEKVFVSSEHNGSKRDRNLYKIVLNYLGRETKLAHIGDNYKSDFECAKEMGIDAFYYKNVHEIGNVYRADGFSELIGSAYSGIVNTTLHNGTQTFNPYYEYGFIYGGLYVLGYCNWIYQYAKRNQIDKVLFLARDGEVYHEVFNIMFKDQPNEYVFWSRIANTKYTIEVNRDDFLTRMVQHKATGVLDISAKGLLDFLGLSELTPKLSYYGLTEETVLHTGNVRLFEQLFVDNWDFVVSKLTKDDDIVKQYFKSIIQDAKKVAVVDVGWIGSGARGIKYLIEEKWRMDCEVKSLVAAARHWDPTANIAQIMNGETEAYIFTRNYNRLHYDVHSNTNNNTNNIYFELFTQACYPSFAGFERDESGDYKMTFDVPEVENYAVYSEIRRGIIDFVYLYVNTFKKYPYMLNISGYDAYLPYRFIIRDLRFIKKYFGDLRYSRGVGADVENQTFETLNDIMKQSKV